jgi:hypothetical protein
MKGPKEMHTESVKYRDHIIDVVVDAYEKPYILMEVWVGVFPNQVEILDILTEKQIEEIEELVNHKISHQ